MKDTTASTLLVLLFLCAGLNSNFYLKVDTIERCLIDSFRKNQEVMIRVEAYKDTPDLQYELKISIKDIEYRYYESQKFLIKNEEKKNIIYSHLADTEVFVCFQADREMYFKVKIDAKIEVPENLIKSDEMYGLENKIYRALQDLVDFNKKNQNYEESDNTVFDDNLKLNSRLVNLTLLESLFIIVMGLVQYAVLKSYINEKK